jgi:hypothetical protein
MERLFRAPKAVLPAAICEQTSRGVPQPASQHDRLGSFSGGSPCAWRRSPGSGTLPAPAHPVAQQIGPARERRTGAKWAGGAQIRHSNADTPRSASRHSSPITRRAHKQRRSIEAIRRRRLASVVNRASLASSLPRFSAVSASRWSRDMVADLLSGIALLRRMSTPAGRALGFIFQKIASRASFGVGVS